MKNGLVMEGGAMRGLFTAGVLDVMMENQIIPDAAIGVSAGAAFGCNIKSHQIGRAIRYNIRFSHDWRYCSVLSWILTGDLYGGKYDYHVLPEQLDIWDRETFRKNPMKFYVVATNVKNAKPLYHICSDGEDCDLRWIQGSASMPIASKPVHVDGFELLDGGISDSIPMKFFANIGYEHSIVICTQPIEYRKVAPSDRTEKIYRTALKKYPAIYDQLMVRHEMYNAQVEDVLAREQAGEILVIRPEAPLNISSMCHDPQEKMRVYDEGRRVALKHLQQMKDFYRQ